METDITFFGKKSNIKFKSYYVVWKPILFYFDIIYYICLNRTM